MKPSLPLICSLILAFLMNAFPIFMAFIVGDEGWATAGWAFYFFTIPIGLLLILLGFIISLVLFFIGRKNAKNETPDIRE